MKILLLFNLALISLALISLQLSATVSPIVGEELVPIQLVSDGQKSFVINLGKINGVRLGQEMLFSNKNISIRAQAIEVSRHMSQWRPFEEDANVPFQRFEIVIMNPQLDTIYDTVVNFNDDFRGYKFKEFSSWTFRGMYSYALSESVSDASGDQKTTREGNTIEGLYSTRATPQFEIGFGLRYDLEILKIPDVGVRAPHRRLMGAVELLYHFSPIQGSPDHFFMGIGLAIGPSSTRFDEAVKAGYSFALPVAKLGYFKKMSSKYAFIFEAIVESIQIRETFKDKDLLVGDSGQQETGITNLKLSLGIKF